MLSALISRKKLETLAGTIAFQRGEAYFAVGAVQRLHATEHQVTATVQGTYPYQVKLRSDGGNLAYHCTCPRAAEGYFCKHGVALGLAWLAENSATPESCAAPGMQKRDPWRDIEAYLGTQAQQTLIDLLLEVAQRDDRLYQSLWLKAKRASAPGNVMPAFRQAIDEATRMQGFIDWEDAGSFAGDIDPVVDSLAELLKPDTAAALVELAEYAIERVEHSLEQVDDSNGEGSDITCRLGELHLQACLMARPDPAALAGRLFRLATTLPFGLCSFDALTYRDALGELGLRRYRELAETEWRKLKPLDAQNRYDSRRATITRIMEQLAEASGNVDELVAIKAHDLSSAYRYLDIAETWSTAGQPDKALEWAERGLRAFPEKTDNRLRDFLVAAYLQRQRNDEALQLTWVQFEERPSLEHCKKLNDVARKLGTWPEQRERALAAVAEFIAREAAATSHWKPKPSLPNYSLRVEIALWEDDLDAAWKAAHAGGCDQQLLIRLAGKLEPSRPDDAISLYRRVVPPIVERTNNAAYEEAIGLIRKMGSLMKARNQPAAFDDYLAQLRAVQAEAKFHQAAGQGSASRLVTNDTSIHLRTRYAWTFRSLFIPNAPSFTTAMDTKTSPLSLLNDPSLLKTDALVNGQWLAGASRFDVTDPSNGNKLADVANLGPADAEAAIAAANAAWPAWRGKTGKERSIILRKWFDLLMANQEDLGRIMTAEQGKPFVEARGEVAYGASFVEWFAEEAKRVNGETLPQFDNNRRLMVLKQPIGVCVAITPWNFPLAMITRKVAPALAAGCTVVIKPAELTPLTALAAAELAVRAGVPSGVLNILTTDASAAVGKVFCDSDVVRHISFTGSTEVGRILMAQSAPSIKKLSLELGGNAPFIVFDDADIDSAVEGAMASKYRNAGQTCVCANRIYVQENVYDQFVHKFAEKVKLLKVGNGFEDGVGQGPLIEDSAVEKVQRHVQDALAKGGKLLAGGHKLEGQFFEPTVISEASADMLCAREETFGPFAPVFRFVHEQEAIDAANNTEFGLASYFYSRDIGRIYRVAEALEYGMVGINAGVIATEHVPFGGVKQSGLGREGSSHGMEEYLEIKYLCLGDILK